MQKCLFRFSSFLTSLDSLHCVHCCSSSGVYTISHAPLPSELVLSNPSPEQECHSVCGEECVPCWLVLQLHLSPVLDLFIFLLLNAWGLRAQAYLWGTCIRSQCADSDRWMAMSVRLPSCPKLTHAPLRVLPVSCIQHSTQPRRCTIVSLHIINKTLFSLCFL